MSTQDKSPPNADDLDDLLSDFDDDEDAEPAKPTLPQKPKAPAVAAKPVVPAMTEAQQAEEDGLFDALLDESQPVAEAPASKGAKSMAGPSSVATTLRTPKPAPAVSAKAEEKPAASVAAPSVRSPETGVASMNPEEEAALAELLEESENADVSSAEELVESEGDEAPISVLTHASLHPAPPKTFPNEEDANARLIQAQKRDAWAARAAWMQAEARLLEDNASRARMLITVAELYAMAGDESAAFAAATEARDLAPQLPLSHQQVRALLERAGEPKSVLESLDFESKSMPNPAARCHVTLLAAEFARIRLSDSEGAKKRYEQAARILPSDPRPHVQRFCEALAEPDLDPASPSPLPKSSLPNAKELAPLSKAFAQVTAHRGLPTKGQRLPGSLYESLLRTRSALAANDFSSALTHMDSLRNAPELAGGAAWLSAAFAGARSETRPRVTEALKAALGGSHPDLARRTLAAYAVELGDAKAAAAALDDPDSSAFEAADRIALAALAGGSPKTTEPWIDALIGDSELAPLASAASASIGDPKDENRKVHPVGSVRSKAAVSLGRLLSSTIDHSGRNLGADGAFEEGVAAYAEVAPDNGLARALKLELDVDAGRGAKVAEVISSWPTDDLDRDRDQALAGALIAEAAGDTERAATDLDRARQTDAKHEGAARARAAHGDAKAAAKIITELAESLGAGARAAILFNEAALRLLDAGETEEADVLLRRAVEIAPKRPLALYLGERAARTRGDRDGVVEWLRMRRNASDDAIEKSFDLVREALLVSDSDATAASSLLEQALAARPSDVGLRELYERLAPEPPTDRAAWRSALAAESTGSESARFSLEAALEYERSGDLARAAEEARKAIAAGENLLAPICAYRCAIAGYGAGDIIDALLPRARATEDAVERLEIYERLAELDELGRNDAANGLLWRKSILEESPNHLPTLRRVASALMSAGRDEELEPVAIEIARALASPEAVAHALLSARLRLRMGNWEDTREPVDIDYRHEPRGLFTLRQMGAHARATGRHALAIEADRQLLERTNRPSELATLSLRASESALASGDVDSARNFLGKAIESVPQHFAAHLALATVASQVGDGTGAATALEAAAESAASPAERALNLYRAAAIWQDKVQDIKRARTALEKVAEFDPSYEDVFQRLQAIYIADGARSELAALLERRLEAVTDPQERIEMEVLRGRALSDVGDTQAAKQALAKALEANPDHVEALSAFATVSAAERDWLDAERAWIHLARLVPETDKQIDIYMKLGALYDEQLPNPERAELSYSEILKRDPASEVARERLVALFKRTGDTAKAIEQQTILINNVEAPEAKCRRTTELASIYEVAGDNKKAEATYLQARKTWPKDDLALTALARFYERTQQINAFNVLLDRALADARRALSTGRFEIQLFGTVASVAELRGKHETAVISKAIVAALDGRGAALSGAGQAAGDTALDDLLAPDLLTPAFRDLLRRTGPLLDAAVPYDLTAVRATPLPPQQTETADFINGLAAVYGIGDVQIYVSTVLGAVCIPASSHPPTLVIGQPLLTSAREDVRAFLVHRALKIVQANCSTFSRTAPIDLWPLLAAYLKLWSPLWQPQGIENARLNEAYGRLTRANTIAPDGQLAALANEVIGSIGNRASTLNTSVNSWGNRVGLLALGDPNIALSGIAWSSGNVNAPPAGGKDRVTWIGRNAEARDLAVFMASDAYSEARNKLGLITELIESDEEEAQEIEASIDDDE